MTTLPVLKGHGTQNDFVLVPDLDGELDLSAEQVRALCDRRAGLGADGVLRVVRTARTGQEPDGSQFFMDYRNADGSIAEMCGNGIRVVAAYLRRAHLTEQDRISIGTRAGALHVRFEPDGTVSVDMGVPQRDEGAVLVETSGWSSPDGRAVRMPNPHVVVPVADEQTLQRLDLTAVPRVHPAGPDGQNVEFVVRRGPRHLRMRVHERGVGETRSCGTGICAAVIATAERPDGQWWQVDVPGGTCRVRWHDADADTDTAAGRVELRGPAVIVAEGTVELDALLA